MRIRINFVDFHPGYDINDNVFTEIIRKRFGDYEISETPDFLFYSVCGTKHYKYKNCVKIFVTSEVAAPDFNECDYAIAFDWIEFGERYFRKPVWLEENRYYKKYNELTSDQALNRKFCNFIYFNEGDGEGAEFRKKFVKRLSEYKRVDCPGKVMNNMNSMLLARSDINWRDGKIEFIKDYKFTIAFENTSYSGYTTEKILHPFIAGSVPLYWGNPLIEKDCNVNAFVNCNGYENNLDEIVNHIIDIDQNDERYLSMLNECPMSNEFNEKELEEFEDYIAKIISKGNVPFNKDPRGWAKRMQVRGYIEFERAIGKLYQLKSKLIRQ